ncbi:MAG: cupin domain-containing protein [Candidatus Aminicenantes bacterium]|nr:cupin domain-containing protein [Candidatus Aminicenantes bacterium]
MRIIARVLEQEGWHLAEAGLPIQLGVRSGAALSARKHLHKTLAEYFLLLAGELKLQVNEATLEMKKGDLVVVEPGETHRVLSATPDTRLLLLMPPPVENDKEELEQPEGPK